MDQPLLSRLKATIEANISDPSFGAGKLARMLGMSTQTLLPKVRQLTGKSISKLISETRLTKALEFLLEENIPVSEVAFRLGFSSVAYFSACFRNHYGYTPSEAREKSFGTHSDLSVVEANEIAETQRTKSFWKDRNRTGKVWLVAGSIFILIFSVALIFLSSTGKAREKISIAVLPLRDLTLDATSGNDCEYLWEQVITTLSKIKVFDVRSAISSGQYRGIDKSMTQIGKELKADYIIEGSMGQEGGQYKVWIQLIRAKTDTHFWDEDYIFQLSGLDLNLQMVKMAENVAYQLNTGLQPAEKSAILLACSESMESMENFQQGRFWLKEGDFPLALSFFQKACEKDSTWGNAYLYAAAALQNIFRSEPKREYMEQRIHALEKANALMPEGSTLMALARYYRDEGNLKKSWQLFKEARKKFPDNEYVFYNMGYYCRYFGRWKEAKELLLKHQLVRPDDVFTYYNLGETYEMMRDFPEAIKCFNQGISVNPDFSFNYLNLAWISIKWKGETGIAREFMENAIQQNQWSSKTGFLKSYLIFLMADIYEGRFEEAIDELSRWVTFIPESTVPPYKYFSKYLCYAMTYGYSGQPDLERAYYDSTRIFIEKQLNEMPDLKKRPGVISCLGMAYAGLGDTVKALSMVKQVESVLSEIPDKFYGPFAMEDVAWIYTKTGNYPKALEIIRNLLSRPGPLTAKLLEIDPKWEPLRELPGFKKMIDKFTIDVVPVKEDVLNLALPGMELPEVTGPTFTDDRDGNVYHYKQIGNQVWMTQNLAYLPAVSPPDTISITDKRHYVYDYRGTSVAEAKESANYSNYGVLYNWEAARTACPPGWHLPNDGEWKILEKNLGMSKYEADFTGLRNTSSVGLKLRPAAGWKKKENGDNSSGFFAFPGGFHHFDMTFNQIGQTATFWSSTEFGDSQAISRHMRFDFAGVNRTGCYRNQGISVRCVRN